MSHQRALCCTSVLFAVFACARSEQELFADLRGEDSAAGAGADSGAGGAGGAPLTGISTERPGLRPGQVGVPAAGGPSEAPGEEVEPPAVPEEPTEAEPVGPQVVGVSPANGATGVLAEEPIVVTFNVGMNRELTEAAYQSEGIPSSSVDFSWNEASTELTITPREPLPYDSGTDPALLEARRFSFFLSASAEDGEGNPLAEAFESSFSIFREVVGSLAAVRNRDLTGSYRANDTYGAGACAREEETVCVGDSMEGDEVFYRGFVTFALEPIPEPSAVLSFARLSFQIDYLEGTPFELGPLRVEHTSFEQIGMGALQGDPLSDMGPIADQAGNGDVLSIDVRQALAEDIQSRTVAQFRLSFTELNDLEEDFDVVVTSWDSYVLDFAYLLP